MVGGLLWAGVPLAEGLVEFAAGEVEKSILWVPCLFRKGYDLAVVPSLYALLR